MAFAYLVNITKSDGSTFIKVGSSKRLNHRLFKELPKEYKDKGLEVDVIRLWYNPSKDLADAFESILRDAIKASGYTEEWIPQDRFDITPQQALEGINTQRVFSAALVLDMQPRR